MRSPPSIVKRITANALEHGGIDVTPKCQHFMRLCYYLAPSGVCLFTHVTREKLPVASGGLRKALSCGLPTYVGILNRSESVTHVTAQNLHAATQARCALPG